MWLEQAVFTSSKTRHGEGYHIVARSPGVSSELAIALARWCPSHAALQSKEVDAESTNFHPLTTDTVALSRTVYGVKEFSGRGGLQVVTIVIVIRQNQLAGYQNNCFRLARVARSLGHLRWRPSFSERLPSIELPNRECSESLLVAGKNKHCLPNQVADMLRAGQRVALVADSSACELGEEVVGCLSMEERLKCFFTTGLKWSKQRPYRLQILQCIDNQLSMRIKSHQTRIVTAQHAVT